MQTCERNELVRRNTFLYKNGNKEKLATWRNYNGGFRNRIDFFTTHQNIEIG